MSRFLLSIILFIAMLMAHGLASAFNGVYQNQANTKPMLTESVLAESVGRVDKVSIDASNKPLCEVMREIHALSGAAVKLPENLAGDLISRSVRGDTWQAIVGHLLEGYNYTAVWGGNGRPLQLTVYSRNQNAEEIAVAPARTIAGADLLIYETSAPLPLKFHGLNPGSVSPVSLPVERMKEMAIGDKASLTLPCGQFEVVYDKRFQQENGNFTWVGYLESAGKAYRVIITLESEGNQGQVVTPNGVYNLDLEEGRTWLVDVGSSAL